MNRILLLTALLFALAFPSYALAGPEGVYRVEGTNPGDGSAYSGTVAVERNGQTYTVVWDVGGSEYIGTGLGAAYANGHYTMGPASSDDSVMAVSYISGNSFGQTFYVEQSNGQWIGIWAYGGAREIGTETWTPE